VRNVYPELYSEKWTSLFLRYSTVLAKGMGKLVYSFPSDSRLMVKDLKSGEVEFYDASSSFFDKIEVLVNLSGINSETYNRKILSKYRELVNGVTINYIDQCLDYSMLVNLSYKYKDLPLKFFGTGKVIPDDIEAASAERILAGMFHL
jgi:hypothetical protein